jgi:putative FmdB family regulatory protein
MPTYEYSCRDCGESLEVTQAFTDDALTECPKCGGSLRKVFGAVGIVFKGSGFYKTDNRSGTKGSSGDATPASTPSTTETKASESPKETAAPSAPAPATSPSESPKPAPAAAPSS